MSDFSRLCSIAGLLWQRDLTRGHSLVTDREYLYPLAARSLLLAFELQAYIISISSENQRWKSNTNKFPFVCVQLDMPTHLIQIEYVFFCTLGHFEVDVGI